MGFLDLVFPRVCLNCGKSGNYLCESCIKKVGNRKPICPECLKPSIDGFTHIKCRKRYGIDGLTTLWEYEGVIRKSVITMKYKYASDIAIDLATFALEVLSGNEFLIPDNFSLVPVPIHWYRGNVRGFNQSSELGKLIAKGMGWKFFPDILVRKKYTQPQVRLRGNERRKNIKGVFGLNPEQRFLAENYILFDDVYTTGSTLKEAAKVLKRAGAGKVWGLTIAR